jgi:hypothetical protein
MFLLIIKKLLTSIAGVIVEYWKPILIVIIIAATAWKFEGVGYDKAKTEYALQRAKEVEAELTRLKKLQNELSTMKVKYEKLETEYDEAVKADDAYKCPVPDSLRRYINNI